MEILDEKSKIEINIALVEVFTKVGYLQKCSSSGELSWKTFKLNIYIPVMQEKLGKVLLKTHFMSHSELCSYIVNEFSKTIKDSYKLNKKEKIIEKA